MNKNSLRRALALSLLLSVVFPAVYMVFFAQGIEFEPSLDLTTFSKLSLDEQANIVEEKASSISGLQAIISNSNHPYFWLEYGKLMVFGFCFSFLTIVTILLWEQRVIRSNQSLNQDGSQRRRPVSLIITKAATIGRNTKHGKIDPKQKEYMSLLNGIIYETTCSTLYRCQNSQLIEITFIVIGVLILAIHVWLAFMASVAIYCDNTLELFQRYFQWTIAWVIPLIGASFVLHLVYEHSPEAIPKKWIPWPFKGMIFGKPAKPNEYRSENDPDIIYSKRDTNDFDSGDDD